MRKQLFGGYSVRETEVMLGVLRDENKVLQQQIEEIKRMLRMNNGAVERKRPRVKRVDYEPTALAPENVSDAPAQEVEVAKTEPVVEEVAEVEPVEEVAEAEPVAEIAEVEPVAEVAEVEPVEEVAESEPVAEVAEVEPVEEVAAAEPVVEVSEVEPVAEVAEVEPVEESAEVEPVEEIAEVEPVEEIAEVEPVEEVAEAEPVAEIAEVEPVEEIAEVEPVVVSVPTEIHSNLFDISMRKQEAMMNSTKATIEAVLPEDIDGVVCIEKSVINDISSIKGEIDELRNRLSRMQEYLEAVRKHKEQVNNRRILEAFKASGRSVEEVLEYLNRNNRCDVSGR